MNTSRVAVIGNQFESTWRPDQSLSEIGRYLPPVSDPDHLPVLIDLVCRDLDRRYQTGQEVDLSRYLTEFPQLKADPAGLIELIEADCLQRRCRYPREEVRAASNARPRPVDGEPGTRREGASDPAVAAVSPHYEIMEELGRGGMGVVYRARQLSVGRVVALKILLPDTPAEVRDRFLTEAEAVAAIEHPNVVQVFDFGQFAGRQYLVLEYCEGGTLLNWARWNTPSIRDAVEAVVKVAGGVQAAHDRGIIHRDLKPANVLRDARGEPKVADFGLAKRQTTIELTKAGDVFGTPAYMSPEQAGDTKSVGPAADVYALGAILYELLTGLPPFRGETTLAVLDQVLRCDPVGVRAIQPGIPRDLEAICLKCLEKAPARRYPSAASLADDLGRFLRGEPTQARPIRLVGRVWKRVKKAPGVSVLVALTLAVVLAAVAGGVWVWGQRIRDEVALVESRQAERVQRFFAVLNGVRERRANPYPGWTADTRRDLRELVKIRDSSGPALADRLPDLCSEAATALTAIDPRPVRALGEGFSAHAVAFSPDGRQLAAGAWRSGEVRIFDPATGATIRTLKSPGDLPFPVGGLGDGCRSVAFSPDGRWLVAGTRNGRLARWDLASPNPNAVVWSAHEADGRNPKRVWVSALVFSADAKVLLSSSVDVVRGWDVGGNWAPRWDVKGSLPRGSFPVAGEKAVVQVNTGGQLVAADLDLQTGTVTSRNVHLPEAFCVNRDGDLLGLSTLSEKGVSVAPLDGAIPRWELLTRSPGQSSPHIESLAFDPSGGLLVTSEEQDRRIKFWDTAAGQLAAEVVADGGKGMASCRIAFSPDGQFLAVAEQDKVVLYDLNRAVHRTAACGPHRRVYTGAPSADGREVTTVSGDFNKLGRVCRWTDTGRPERLTGAWLTDQLSVGNTPAADLSPAGRTFAFSAREQTGADGRVTDRVVVSGCGAIKAEGANDLRFDPAGRLWIADSHEIRVLEFPSGRQSVPVRNGMLNEKDGMPFWTIAPGRRHALAGRRDGRVFLVDPAGGREPTSRSVLRGGVASLALSPDETMALVGGERGEVVLLPLPTGEPRPISGAHNDIVRAAVFGPQFLVTGAADRAVKFWATGGGHLFTIRMEGEVRKLSLSGDGKILFVFTDGERGVRVFDLAALSRGFTELGLPATLTP